MNAVTPIMDTENQKLSPGKSDDVATTKLFPATATASFASEPPAEFIQARQLVGHAILIVATGRDIARNRPIAFVRQTNGGELLCFRTGQVVTEQLQNVPLPVWAVMTMVEGKKHPYYWLILAETIKVERIAPTLEETLCILKTP